MVAVMRISAPYSASKRDKSLSDVDLMSDSKTAEEHLLHKIAEAICAKDFSFAHVLLRQYMSMDMENPEAYNLLGIAYEMEGDRAKATKFYRVAYSMDQTFRAPAANLDRLCGLWHKDRIGISWGLDSQEVDV